MIDDKLKSYVDRIERLADERDDRATDIREVYVEVGKANYSPKVLRKIIAERRRKTDEQLEAELETYRAALGMASYRDAAKLLGVSKSKLQRLVPRKQNGTVEHDADGVIATTPPVEPGGAAGQALGEGQSTDKPTGSPAATSFDESCSPALATSAEVDAADVPTGNEGSAGEHDTPTDSDLLAAMDDAREKWNEAKREAMYAAQRESWVRGEMGMGNDADEAAYRASFRRPRS